MPFGAAASGLAWHKIGDLLCQLGRKLLGIPLFRYVDDYFAVDRQRLFMHTPRVFMDFFSLSTQAGNSEARLGDIRATYSCHPRPRCSGRQESRIWQRSGNLRHQGTQYSVYLFHVSQHVTPRPIFVEVSIDECKAHFSICPKKCEKWKMQLNEALASGFLNAGDASKLAGRSVSMSLRLPLFLFGRTSVHTG